MTVLENLHAGFSWCYGEDLMRCAVAMCSAAWRGAQALHQMHKILGQVDILGVPIGLGRCGRHGMASSGVPATARAAWLRSCMPDALCASGKVQSKSCCACTAMLPHAADRRLLEQLASSARLLMGWKLACLLRNCSTLFSGISSLVVTPTRARSPEEFVRSVGAGALVLLQSAAYGVCNAFGQVGAPDTAPELVVSCPALLAVPKSEWETSIFAHHVKPYCNRGGCCPAALHVASFGGLRAHLAGQSSVKDDRVYTSRRRQPDVCCSSRVCHSVGARHCQG